MSLSIDPQLGGSRSAGLGRAPATARVPSQGDVNAPPPPDERARRTRPEGAAPGEATGPEPRRSLPLSSAALLFLRGRDADARIEALVAERRTLRPALGVLAARLVRARRYEPLGFRSLGDYARERLGLTAHALREGARVAEALGSLPLLREAVLCGAVSWSVARRAVAHATPETDGAFAAALRGRTVRAAEAMLRAAFGEAYERQAAAREEGRERVRVSAPLPAAEHPRWLAALELARQVAGENLPVWECAEAIAAEALAALPPACVAAAADAEGLAAAEPASPSKDRPAHGGEACGHFSREPGLRHEAFRLLRWPLHAPLGAQRLDRLAESAQVASPHALDRALRRIVRRMQRLDHDLGQLLRQVLDRRLYRELGFVSFERYVEERTEVSPRTARRWVRLARLGPAHGPLATALRSGEVTALQASRIGEAAPPEDHAASVDFARRVTLRQLEDELAPALQGSGAVQFSAPPEVANVFRLALAAVELHLGAQAEPRRLALPWMLEHAIAQWTAQGESFDDYADFTRDGFRCTAPGCTARRSLHSHHIVFRSQAGADEPWNRTTLCAFHHQRGVHAGTVSCRGRAPGGLVFALGVRPVGPPLLRAASGDVLLDGDEDADAADRQRGHQGAVGGRPDLGAVAAAFDTARELLVGSDAIATGAFVAEPVAP